ncbi:MAG: tetratricopeptide repeat protein, partial [Pseudobdellovibrionaceae bacterium]
AFPYLEKLAYYYSDRGDKEAARTIFRGLIEEKPTNPKAFEYQYQIVQNYFYQKNSPQFKEELYRWIRSFGQESAWYKTNASNKTLIDNGVKLQETTLRNYILQNHQNAQDSRVSFVQNQANEGYLIYIKEFSNSPLIGDMHFYYGELLYDMNRYEDSAVQYRWVVENVPNSKFYDKSAQNLILAFERAIPKDEEFQKRVGNSLNPIPLDNQSKKFVENAEWYIQKFPTSERATEIKFRVGRIYYQTNQFDKAEVYFKDIVKNQPNSKYAEYSANLLLDIFNLKKDYVGLEKAGQELLALPSMSNSKAGQEIRSVIERASFKKAQDLEGQKNYPESAQQFENFVTQNPKSTLVPAALYNAAVNYERSGDNAKALRNYQIILTSNTPEAAKLKPKVSRFVAKLNQDSGQFEEAAKIYRQLYRENPGDPLAMSYLYNSAILYEALGKEEDALRAYGEYTQKSKRLADSTDALFSMATLYRKRKQFSLAYLAYRDYLNLAKLDERSIEAGYYVYDIAKKTNQKSLYEDWKQKTLGMHRRLGGNVGSQFAAKIKLHEVNLIYLELKAVQIPQNPQKQKAALDRKIDGLKKLNNEIGNVIKFNSGDEIVDSLYILGEANQHMYQSIVNAPLPDGLSADDVKKYKTGVEQLAQPFMAKSRESFKSCVDRAQELEAYNENYEKAYDIVAAANSKSYYNQGEQGFQTYFVNWMIK